VLFRSHLGQTSDSDEFVIQLTRVPNELRFHKDASQPNFNPITVTVGDVPSYQVVVLDDAGRRVPNQLIEWTLTSIPSDGSTPQDIQLGSVASNLNGLSLLNFNSAQIAGLHTLRARLTSDNKIIETARRIRIDAGQTSEVRFGNIDFLKAGEVSSLRISAHDAAGNLVVSDSISRVQIDIPFAGFHFGFTNNIQVRALPTGGETAEVVLRNGLANIPLTVAQVANNYSVGINVLDDLATATTYVTDNSPLSIVETDTIPITVVPSDPFQLRLVELSRTNHPLGEVERLEAGETVTLAAQFEDQYFNRIAQLNPQTNPQDANFSIDVSVSGSATVNGQSGTSAVAILQGIAQLTIFDDSVETVQVNIDSTTLGLASVQTLTGIELDFEKRKPAIDDIQFTEVMNSELVPLVARFTELVSYDSFDGPAASVSLAGLPITGEFTAATISQLPASDVTVLTFVPESSLSLGQCYDFDTNASPMLGVAANDPVLSQVLNVCAPQVLIAVLDDLYVLEGSSFDFAIKLDAGILPSSLQGDVLVSRIVTEEPLVFADQTTDAINWAAPQFILPVHTGTQLTDGQVIQIRIQPSDSQNTPLSVGNFLQLTVLQADGDFDNDGLPNGLEFSLPGLHPANADSDNDGLLDGDEDQDNDGLRNSEELAAGTLLDNADSDGDGLSDFEEVQIYGSNPLLVDSDGDGIPDYVEVASDTNPADPLDAFVDPFYITDITVTPTTINHTLGFNGDVTQLNVVASFVFDGQTDSVDITNFDLLTYNSSNPGVANADSVGVVTFLSEGDATISAVLLDNVSVAAAVVEVIVTAPTQTNNDFLQLMPMELAQVLYRDARAQHSLWIEINTPIPVFSIDQILFEGTAITWEAETDHTLKLFIPNDLVTIISGSSTLIEFTILLYGDESPGVYSLTVPVVDDPETSVSLLPGQPLSLNLQVGEAVDIPVLIEDAGLNDIDISYVVNGVPLGQESAGCYTIFNLVDIESDGPCSVYSFEFDVDDDVGSYTNIIGRVNTYQAGEGLSNSSDYSIQMYIFDVNDISESGLIADACNTGCVYSPNFFDDKGGSNLAEFNFNINLPLGSYQVVVGNYPLSIEDAIQGANSQISDFYTGFYFDVNRVELDVGIFEIDFGVGNSATTNAPSVNAVPVENIDRVERYQATKNLRTLDSSFLGQSILTVQASELLGDGSTRTQDIADITLNVTDPAQCEIPVPQTIYPQASEILYNEKIPSPRFAVCEAGVMDNLLFGNPCRPLIHEFQVLEAGNYDFTVEGAEISYLDIELATAINGDYGDFITYGEFNSQSGSLQVTLQPGPHWFLIYAAQSNISPFVSFDVTVTNTDSGNTLEPTSVHGEPLSSTINDTRKRPISFKANTIGGTGNITWLNQPAELSNSDYEFKTLDSVTYTLSGDASYDAIFANGLTSVDLEVTSACGLLSAYSIPLTLGGDPAPSISIIDDLSGYTLMQGEQTHISVSVSDASRNVQRIRAQLFAVGDTTTVLATIADQEFTNQPIDRDTFNYRLPMSIQQIAIGNYDLVLTVEDGGSTAVTTSPVPVTIIATLTEPTVIVVPPSNNVPAGGLATFEIEVSHFAALVGVDVQVSGNSVQTISDSIVFNNETYAFSKSYDFTVNNNAVVGDSFNVDVTAIDSNGVSITKTLILTVGIWGENTVTISNDQLVDASMRFANVIVENNAELTYTDETIQFNTLDLRTGASLIVTDDVDNLIVNEYIVIDSFSDITVATTTKTAGKKKSHGGDVYYEDDGFYDGSYGDFRQPQFPGSSSHGTQQYQDVGRGGGYLHIAVPTLTNNGRISANGGDNNDNPGSGGSVWIEVNTLHGGGVIEANGGSTRQEQRASAGGRIAINYGSSGGGECNSPLGCMSLRAYPSSVSSPINGSYSGGAGTVFVKRASQQFGELLIDNNGRGPGLSTNELSWATTTLRSIGEHTVFSIDATGVQNQYRITVPGAPWNAPDLDEMELGITGLQVSLDASDTTSPLYSIVSNDESSFVIETGTDISGTLGNNIIGVIRLDRIRTRSSVAINTEDRIYASEFSVESIETFDSVKEFVTDQTTDYTDLSLIDTTTAILGNVNVNNLFLTRGSLRALGQVNVSGSVFVSDGPVPSASAIYANHLSVGGNLEIDSAILNLGSNVTSQIDGNLVIANNSVLSLPVGRSELKINLPQGSLSVDSSSVIDANERGGLMYGIYSGDKYNLDIFKSFVCHGGGATKARYEEDLKVEIGCAYGNYRNVNTGGSAIRSVNRTYRGGGFIDINALSIFHDGLIQANSSTLSGGGVNLSAGLLQGNGAIEAIAYIGGRISIEVENQGSYTGAVRTQSGTQGGAVGTVFRKTNSAEFGSLFVQSDSSFPRFQEVTPIRSVGRHTIQSVESLGNDLWQINTADTDQLVDQTLAGSFQCGGGDCDVPLHSLNLTQASRVVIESGIIPASGPFNPTGIPFVIPYVFQTAGDELYFPLEVNVNEDGDHRPAQDGNWVFDLPAGNYDIAIGLMLLQCPEGCYYQELTSDIDIAAGVYQNLQQGIAYDLKLIASAQAKWGLAQNYRDIKDLHVSLDASNANPVLYKILSNSQTSFVIESFDDLSTTIGNELIGIHRFETITIEGGVNLNFGEDRVIVDDIFGSSIYGESGIFADPSSNIPLHDPFFDNF